MAAVRHLGFAKFEFFLIVWAVNGHILHQRTKFYKDRSNRYGDIAIFVIFQDGGRRHLDFQKLQILTADPLYEGNMGHCTKCHQNRSNNCRDMAI